MRGVIGCMLIVAKAGSAEASSLCREVAGWLAGRGVSAQVAENTHAGLEEALCSCRNPDLVLVLGGDGTILSVARKVMDLGIPLFGVNLGHVGFLTEVGLDDWKSALATLLEQDFVVRERLALHYEVVRDGVIAASGQAVNDLVINRGQLARLVDLEVFIDGVQLGAFNADGLIVSTPVGSTGYTLSAGGPLVHPSLQVFSVALICPFLREFPPLVVPGDKTVRIVVRESASSLYLSLDGQEGVDLRHGDEVLVRRAARGPLFASLDGASYFAKLRSKGFLKAFQRRMGTEF